MRDGGDRELEESGGTEPVVASEPIPPERAAHPRRGGFTTALGSGMQLSGSVAIVGAIATSEENDRPVTTVGGPVGRQQFAATR